ncbi:MAG: hypothetical protein ABUL68_04515 [Pseudomonadota bacterium]
MKLSILLRQRPSLLGQARLANLAFACAKLGDFAERIGRARLSGEVSLKPAAPDAGQFWPALIALNGRQSVIEEHFTDEDLMDLADILAFLTGGGEAEFNFRLENLAEKFLAPLCQELAQAGIVLDQPLPSLDQPGRADTR